MFSPRSIFSDAKFDLFVHKRIECDSVVCIWAQPAARFVKKIGG